MPALIRCFLALLMWGLFTAHMAHAVPTYSISAGPGINHARGTGYVEFNADFMFIGLGVGTSRYGPIGFAEVHLQSDRWTIGLGGGIARRSSLVSTPWAYRARVDRRFGNSATPWDYRFAIGWRHYSNCASFLSWTGSRCLGVFPRGSKPNFGADFIVVTIPFGSK